MPTKLQSHPLKTRSKQISRLRAVERLTWMAIARKLVEGEISAPPFFRDKADLEHPEYYLLLRSYARSAQTIFDNLCEMGYETPPPADAVFHTLDCAGRATEDDPRLSERLDALKAELISAETEEVRELVEIRIRSERQRLTNLRRRAAERVRHGRPFMDGEEAAAHLPPIAHMEGAQRVHKPYPAISDLELLGPEKYDKLIAERVAEVKRRPGAKQSDLHLAANPHLAALPDDPNKEESIPNDIWFIPEAPYNDVVDSQFYGRVLTTVVLCGTVAWDIKPGRRPVGEPSTYEIATVMFELAAAGEFEPSSTAFENHVATLNHERAIKKVVEKVNWARRKYNLGEPVTPATQGKLRHLNLVTDQAPLPQKPDERIKLQWRDNPNGDEDRENWTRATVEGWAKVAWTKISEFYQDNPSYSF